MTHATTSSAGSDGDSSGRPGPEPAGAGGAGAGRAGPAEQVERVEPPWLHDFDDRSHEWRRLFSETFGTFLLVLAAAGADVINHVSAGEIARSARVTAPALTVLAVILFMGKVSGAHLNPVVSVAFALRKEFPWRRVPAYVVAQLLGAVLASGTLWAIFGGPGRSGGTLPGHGITDLQAMAMEILLTLGLVSTILGTASGAQNVGHLSAIAVGAYIALAGLWASPVSGASMNPARSFGPALIGADFDHFWPYLVGPLVGCVAAVGAAGVLRGPGGDPGARKAAQGTS